MEQFITQEYEPFPVSHADLFDIMSRIMDEDLQTMWPQEWEAQEWHEDAYERAERMQARRWTSPWAQ